MLGYVLASLCVLISQFHFFRHKFFGIARTGKDHSNAFWWRQQMREYAWPYAAWGAFTWAQMSSDRWALQIFGTTSDVGLYSILYQLGYYPIILLTQMMVQLLAPILFSEAGNATDPGRIQRTRTMVKTLIIGTLLFTLIATVLASLLYRKIFEWLISPEYHSASILLPWFALSAGVFAAGQVASLLPMSNMKTRMLLTPKIGTAVFGVFLNIVGAYKWGMTGVVFASIIFSSAYFCWVLWLAKRFPNPMESAK